MELAQIIAALAQLPVLIAQLKAAYDNIVSNLSEADKVKLEAELARLRAAMPAEQAAVRAALDAAAVRP